jgi:hypothetical protein
MSSAPFARVARCHPLHVRAGQVVSEASDPHAGLESRGQQGPARLWLAEMSSPTHRHRHSTHVIRNLLTLPPPSSGRSDAGNRDLNSSDVAAGSVVVLLDDPDRLPPLPAAHLICQQTHGLPAQRRGSITSDRPAEARLGSRSPERDIGGLRRRRAGVMSVGPVPAELAVQVVEPNLTACGPGPAALPTSLEERPGGTRSRVGVVTEPRV